MRHNIAGSEGISAMIIFVTLTLTAAIISSLLIKTGEILSQRSQADAEDDQSAVYGKVIITDMVITAITFDAQNNPDSAVLLITLELTPGTPLVDDDDVLWAVLCPDETNSDQMRWSNEGNFESVTTASGDGGDVAALDEMRAGITYMLAINLFHDADDGCPPNYTESHTLAITVGGSGSASIWELRYGEYLQAGTRLY